ncbi:MAG: hypothetical protein JST84_17900 [Acidobacteria bacterium]|nr:hypothetical protein [Acidobacteriota bacterium]
MIRINLLNSAVENTNLDVVESAISNRGTQQTVLLLIAAGACLLAIGLDWIVTKRDFSRVKTEVEAEEARATQLAAVTKQAKELQEKNKAVEERISAIMRLRAEQTGPLRLLQMMDGKMPADSQFRLTSIIQSKPEKDKKEDSFTLSGYSPNEAQITAFAKNLEFSDGWFTKFTVEVGRGVNPEMSKDARPATDSPASKGAVVKEAPKEVVRFTIRCSYNPQNLLVNPTSAPEPGNGQAAQPQPSAPPKTQ